MVQAQQFHREVVGRQVVGDEIGEVFDLGSSIFEPVHERRVRIPGEMKSAPQ